LTRRTEKGSIFDRKVSGYSGTLHADPGSYTTARGIKKPCAGIVSRQGGISPVKPPKVGDSRPGVVRYCPLGIKVIVSSGVGDDLSNIHCCTGACCF
jgi:hypothetical protein